MHTKESNIQKLIQLALSRAGFPFWRNDVSGVWVGRVVYQDGDTVTLKNARMVQSGLCTGSSDLIGIGPGGKFAAVEVKRAKGGRVSSEQRDFITAVRGAGGLAGVARSPEEALEILNNG